MTTVPFFRFPSPYFLFNNMEITCILNISVKDLSKIPRVEKGKS